MISDEDLGKEIEALVREHGGPLKGYLQKLGISRDLADDAFTDALLAVVVKRRDEKPLTHPKAFLFTVARNAAFKRLKVLGSELPDSEAVEGAQAPDMLEAIEISADVRRAIMQLPPRQRQVVEFRYLYDFSVAETAQILGMAEGTVGPTTKAALDNLKRIIEEHGG